MPGYDHKRFIGLYLLVAMLVIIGLMLLTGCGANRQCPPGYVNDGNNNCISDGSNGVPMDRDDGGYEFDDD